MKIHPLPKKRNITLRNDTVSTHQKKLRRLPHVFAKVLELPFHSNADVLVEEAADCFRFVAAMADDDEEILREGIRADAVELYPGLTKVVIRGAPGILEFSAAGELELDVWRFRLPASTRPELATAGYDEGELVVTVPKDVDFAGPDAQDDEEVW